ncbi:capsule assembly Wzi family protein [Treponema sp.]|uniref:capsule assembly Wzi family protein n=1 Tax=Treponema sp. TaxID=166 RepID=UPI0025CFAB68|nr:capsule assembly Wzi family protein [Treponema sp.]MBR4323225.1 hypothetical protein [Treponema sp.]
MFPKKNFSLVLFFMTFLYQIFPQEALKSTEEEYYDFLSLQGLVERPTLGYRTLSDNQWKFVEKESPVLDVEGNPLLDENGNPIKEKVLPNHVWQENNLGSKRVLWQSESKGGNWFTRGFDHSIKFKAYGPDWYNSFNTAAPYGQNDGALWQGKGYNTSLTGGVRIEGYGFELTFKPQVCFSQNLEFDYITPNYSGAKFYGKASNYGYYGVNFIDAPQRFGDSAFWTYSWGDTEARWTWKNFTIGFGTQSIWLGPAQLNPIIHSNNASSYPKLDLGLRKIKVTMPHFGWNLGYIEARGWWGKLYESEWFDNDSNNNNNLITGFVLYYQLPFFKEFTMGINRTMVSKWGDKNEYTLFKIYNPFLSSGVSGGNDDSDQRVSITVDYKLNLVGLEMYLEWARNDYSPTIDHYIRYPFHTQGWTFGTRKTLSLPFSLKGQIYLELTSLECSADYDRLIGWYTTFYSHHRVTQGYTNEGQWLGAGIGTGGNSQYIGFTVYHKKGSLSFFGQRRNPDLDYTMYIDNRRQTENYRAEGNIKVILDLGIKGTYFFNHFFQFAFSYIFSDEHNPIYEAGEYNNSTHRYNNHFVLNLKVIL